MKLLRALVMTLVVMLGLLVSSQTPVQAFNSYSCPDTAGCDYTKWHWGWGFPDMPDEFWPWRGCYVIGFIDDLQNPGTYIAMPERVWCDQTDATPGLTCYCKETWGTPDGGVTYRWICKCTMSVAGETLPFWEQRMMPPPP